MIGEKHERKVKGGATVEGSATSRAFHLKLVLGPCQWTLASCCVVVRQTVCPSLSPIPNPGDWNEWMARSRPGGFFYWCNLCRWKRSMISLMVLCRAIRQKPRQHDKPWLPLVSIRATHGRRPRRGLGDGPPKNVSWGRPMHPLPSIFWEIVCRMRAKARTE